MSLHRTSHQNYKAGHAHHRYRLDPIYTVDSSIAIVYFEPIYIFFFSSISIEMKQKIVKYCQDRRMEYASSRTKKKQLRSAESLIL